ncbi:MAG: WD40 repeat domain-containing protein [bacterium]|nr:WD40 repeat domain-containing protein [bacterium]
MHLPSCVIRSAAWWLLLTSVVLLSRPARAQCDNIWLQTSALAGVSGIAQAVVEWDPDGAGPASPVLVVGGRFDAAGDAATENIAVYDPATNAFSALGSGVDGSVNALAVLPNGDLIVGGSFLTAGSVNAAGIARWNGTNWSSVGGGLGTTVEALHVLANGDLVAGGSFSIAGGAPTDRIARWDGTSWTGFAGGIGGTPGARVVALASLPNGDLVAVGSFTIAGGVPTNNVARWDGTTWNWLGLGITQRVESLTVAQNGDVIVGGSFSTAGGVPARGVARWDGTSWSAMGSGLSSTVNVLLTMANGDLIAAGSFSSAFERIARWDGSSWSDLADGLSSTVYALGETSGGDLVAGGNFLNSGTTPMTRVARWDGSSWSAIGPGMDQQVESVLTLPNGEIIAGGDFTQAGSVQASKIARWDGANWHPLSSGMVGGLSNHGVQALARMPNGDIVAGGIFVLAGGVPARMIARWDGANWHRFGAGMYGGSWQFVDALEVLDNGDLIAAGLFSIVDGVPANSIARWDGANWHPLGGGVAGQVHAVEVMPNGHLIVGGSFTTAGGVSANRIARWDGTTWSPLGGGMNNRVHAIVRMPNGDLIAGGEFSTAGGTSAVGIARWDGSSWSALTPNGGSLDVYALTVLPNGDLLVGGDFAIWQGAAGNAIMRYDGTAWSGFDVGSSSFSSDRVEAMDIMPNGDVVVGGSFTVVGGKPSPWIARLSTTCPATVVAYGTTCVGPAGPMTLAAGTLPWTGSTFASSATGFAAGSLGVALVGLGQQSLPLAQLHPSGIAGCQLLTSTEAIQLVVPAAGIATQQFTIPNDPVFAGVTFAHQFLQGELDPQGALLSLSGTSALELTIGAF